MFKECLKKPLKHPIWFGFDFEALLVKMQDENQLILENHQLTSENESKLDKNQKTKYINHHQPISFVLKSNTGEVYTYCGENVGEKFISILEKEENRLINELKNILFSKYEKEIRKYQKSTCKCKFHHDDCEFDKTRPKYLTQKIKELCKCNNKKQHDCTCEYIKQRPQLIKELKEQKCKCNLLSTHAKDCKYKKNIKIIINEFCQIPILGFNSGKYDLTFLTKHMLNKEITNLITKSSSYLKLKYGNWMFLDVRNFIPADKMWRDGEDEDE